MPVSELVDLAPPGPGSRREELLAIAVKLFAEQGVAKTTVRDIADAAGMLSGSLYHHFESKNQIVAEAIGKGLTLGVAANRALIESSPDQAVAVVRLITDIVRWVGEEPDVVKILTNDKAYIRDNPDLRETEETRQVNRRTWIGLIQDGIDAGVFRPLGNVDLVVRSIYDGLFGATRWMYGDLAPEEVARNFAELYLRGILADGYRFDFENEELIPPD